MIPTGDGFSLLCLGILSNAWISFAVMEFPGQRGNLDSDAGGIPRLQGRDPLQRLPHRVGGQVPRGRTQVPGLRVVQHLQDQREPQPMHQFMSESAAYQ